MNCLIVDDEVLAQDVVEHYVSRVEGLVLAGKCRNAVEAFAALSTARIDLVFLDIKMPEISGLDFIKALKHPPAIILTTAFPEYALDGYELDVVDYLLKPFSFDRFLKAVQKARPQVPEEKNSAALPTAQPQEFYVKSDRKLIRINPADILYIESQKNYLLLQTLTQKVVTYSTLNNMEAELEVYPHLVRVHKSYMVNKHFITQIDNGMILLQQGAAIPLGASYRDTFLDQMRIL